MDNTKDLPGYKYYVDPATRERPAVYVAFLDLAVEREGIVNGVVFPANDDELTTLDARERNYERHEVTAQIDPPPGGPTYTYVGTQEARKRFAEGRRSATAVIARAYLTEVRARFESLGPDALAAYEASTDAIPVPIGDLERVDLLRT
jgi:cation transport regulator ChaC